MNTFIEKKELDKLFHIQKDIGNRVIPLVPVVDDENKFHIWILNEGNIIDVTSGQPILSDYFAKKKHSEKDVYFRFMDFLYQKYSMNNIIPVLNFIRSDMHNLATCLEKLEVYYSLRDNKKLDISRFVITEIEYIFSTCRSMFDLLQLVSKRIWNGIKLVNCNIEKRELPKSFDDIAFVGDNNVEPQDLINKYGLTPLWAKFYNEEADFFKKVRKFRVEIEHHGKTPDIVFVLDKGFAVDSNYQPFQVFNIWRQDMIVSKNLVPLKPLLSFVINETLGTMLRFVDNVLSKEIKFPEDIAPGYYLYMRGPHIWRLAELYNYINFDVWYDDKSL